MLRVKKVSHGRSGDHISVRDSGEPFVKITVRMGTPETISVTISRVLVPIAGEKTALRESLMTSSSNADAVALWNGGDSDLLALSPFQGIEITSPHVFLELKSRNKF